AGRLQQRRRSRDATGENNVRCKRDQIRRLFAKAVRIASAPAEVDTYVTADRPARFLQPLQERRETCLSFRVVRGEIHEHADAAQAFALLRARRERPRRRAAEQRDEIAPLHSITSSARARSVGGISRPNALAVLRLMTNSYLVGSMTGRSAGLAPLRIRAT